MPPDYNYDSDFGRDLLSLYEINQGKLTLIGPRLNFAGLHLSAYYYYLFAPFLRLGNFDHRFIFYSNAVLFILGFSAILLFQFQKIRRSTTFLSILWIATTPYMILAARTPGNAFSYLIFGYIYLVFLLDKQRQTLLRSFCLGLFAGIISNFHPVVIHLLPILFLVEIIIDGQEKIIRKLSFLAWYMLGFLMSFLPVAIFDLRHNFITLKLLFDHKNYLEFFSQSGNFSILNLMTRMVNIFYYTKDFIAGGLIGLFIVVSFICLVLDKNKKILFYYFVSVLSIIILTLIGKGVYHYYFPTIMLLQLLLVYGIKQKKIGNIILFILITVNIIFWPTRFYKPSRNLVEVEKNFSSIISSDFLPKESLNIVLNNQTHISKVGYEYRYLLVKRKYKIDDEYSYKNSKHLLLVSERGSVDWQKEGGWEWAQFGEKKIIRQMQVDNYFYYLFEKKSI